MLDIQQNNQDELHIFVKGNFLRFSIFEFVLHTDLKYTDNIGDFQSQDSSPYILMQKYFFQSTNGVDKHMLVQYFLMKNFDNNQDTLNMDILYFIHIFSFSQLKDAPNCQISRLRQSGHNTINLYSVCSTRYNSHG